MYGISKDNFNYTAGLFWSEAISQVFRSFTFEIYFQKSSKKHGETVQSSSARAQKKLA